MNQQPLNSSDEQDLWRRFREAGQSSDLVTSPIDANQLAAYLAGGAGACDTEQIERAMAADPGFLDAVIALRGVSQTRASDGDVAVPAAVRQAAKSLVQANRVDAHRVLAWPWGQVSRWAAAAVVVLVVGAAGYVTGRDTSGYEGLMAATLAETADLLEEADGEPSFFLTELAVGGVR